MKTPYRSIPNYSNFLISVGGWGERSPPPTRLPAGLTRYILPATNGRDMVQASIPAVAFVAVAGLQGPKKLRRTGGSAWKAAGLHSVKVSYLSFLP